ncbi:hypothetical protein [Lelliottia amnigena]|uniref:hypothetical protein n=1 Tax=Lelliottia amnigena TaxID=61646 RepID=UPI000FA6339C|nr:hypothetical protein [Lelliottia amnigena]QXZ19109.1 hypothetical protein I6L75_18740 [Lelliottia amnigena]
MHKKRIIELAKRPQGVTVAQLSDAGIPVSEANKLFNIGLLSIDIPITKNPVFRIIRTHKYAA